MQTFNRLANVLTIRSPIRENPTGVKVRPRASEEAMSTHATQQQNTGARYSKHVEPLDQGGAAYVRCEACGVELLTSLGGARNLLHARDCPEADR